VIPLQPALLADLGLLTLYYTADTPLIRFCLFWLHVNGGKMAEM